MRRLTKEKWQSLQRLSGTKKTARHIAIEAGISTSTVLDFRRAVVSVDAMPESIKRKMRILIARGGRELTAEKISAMLSVPVGSVRNLRRLDRYREPTNDEPDPPRKRICKFSRKNFDSLLRVVNDLIALGDLMLITNPLFHHLTQRAEKVLKEKNEEA